MFQEFTPDKLPPGFKLRRTLWGHEDAIFRIAWSPDGLTLASASADATVMLWDAATGHLRRTLRGHPGRVYGVTWSPDGRTVASAGEHGRVRCWDAATGQSRLTFKEYPGSVRDVAWSPDGRTIASACGDGTVRLGNAATGQSRLTLKPHATRADGVTWSPDARTIASVGDQGKVKLWDAVTGESRFKQYPPPGPVLDVAWSPDGRTIAYACDDSTVRLLDAATSQLKVVLEGHTAPVLSVSFTCDGRQLASESSDGTVLLWRCDTWEKVAALEEDRGRYLRWLTGMAFHPGEPNVLATLGKNQTVIRIWDLDFDVILKSALERKGVLYTTAKITLVGDSGAGKTGLGWRLAHGEFKEHPSTHGQQFWVLDNLGATRVDGTQCEAVLWDLAGQPDYRLVHALFLDDVDLALVLFDPTDRQEPLKGVEYWLKQLSRAKRDGRRRRVILVGARADRGTPTMTAQDLEEFCKHHGVDGYVSTSALTGAGLPDLLARMKASIVWGEMPATVTSTTFKRIKEFVLALKAEGRRGVVLVSPEELRARLEATDRAWKFTDAEMMTAVRHLANHGYVSVLRGSSGEESILLASDLLANLAASFVLEARRNERGLGALDEARVLKGGYEFPELTDLEKNERDVLLDAATVLFLEHNICFRETLGAQTFLIFPALINQKRPLLEEFETVEDFSYRLSGAVENVYAALVVQLGYTNTFTRTNQWRNQAEYETARGDVCGFRQVEEREGEAELVLYYAKEKAGARLLFQGLFEEFLRGRDVTVTKFPPVGCPECGYRQQRGEVVKRIGEGKGFLFCGECGEKIALPKEGEKVMLSRAEHEQLSQEQERTRRRTAFEAALVRVKAVVRDERKRAPSCFVSYAWGDEWEERWVRGLGKDLENAGLDVILDRKDNSQIGANVARFISRITESDFVVVVGTPSYRQKYENEVSDAGSVAAAEVDLINRRLIGKEEQKATVLPLLLAGDEESSFPPLVAGKVYANFLEDALYFSALFDLILTLYRIPFKHPAVSDLRESLRGGGLRFWE